MILKFTMACYLANKNILLYGPYYGAPEVCDTFTCVQKLLTCVHKIIFLCA